MNPFGISAVVAEVVKHRKKKDVSAPGMSPYRKKKNQLQLKAAIRRFTVNLFLIGMGVIAAGFGLRSFLVPNQFIDGGATGVALLINELTSASLPLLLMLINIPFFALAYKVIGKQFALKTALAIAALALCVAFFPYPDITKDKILVAIFGGFFLGAGIGLAVRGGAVIDGTEVLALYVSRKLGFTVGDVILIINIIIFSFVAWLLSLETALYSVLTYMAASRTVDFIIEGIEEYTGVMIVSIKHEEIRKMITDKMGRGVTVYTGERGFGKSGERHGETKILYSIITRLEINRLNSEIEKIDPNAFVVMNSVKDAKGGMVKKRAHKTIK
ncbi:MAG TPA: YitT family protein [Chitinophagaceae bacterium]|nr:YitT family protein [Chitinophagaceae bacterium]